MDPEVRVGPQGWACWITGTFCLQEIQPLLLLAVSLPMFLEKISVIFLGFRVFE